MKKLFTILTVVILTTTVSFAQFSAKAGLNMANVASNDDDVDMEMKLGLIIGGNYAMELSDEMILDISLAFKQSGAKETEKILGGSETTIWSLNYLDISPNISYSVADQFAVSFGPYLAFALSGNREDEIKITNGPTTTTSESIEFGELTLDSNSPDGISNMDFGINIGATYFINDEMNVSAGYALGLSNIFKVNSDVKDLYDLLNEDVPSLKNNGIYLTFGYSFGG